MAEAATAIVDTPAAKRARTTAGGSSATGGRGSVSSHHTTKTLHGAGFWDDSDDDQEPPPPVDRDAKKKANSLRNDWMEMKVNKQGSLVCFRSCRRSNSCLLSARRSAVRCRFVQ